MTMSLLFHFIIPATPTAKGRARSTVVRGKGGTIVTTAEGRPIVSHHTPEKTRNYEALVKDFAQQALKGAEPYTCPVDLLVEFRFRIPDSWPKWKRELAAAGLLHHTAKPDCSNLVKAIEDACNGVLFQDDGQVVGCLQDKVWTDGQACIAVHGYRRAGVPLKTSKAEAMAALVGYQADMRTNHMPLGRRFRTLHLVTP